MRKIIRYIAILIPLAGSAQSTGESSKPGLPNIVPPAPSVAALMKIEEVPVDNYTGNPGISISLQGFALDSGLSLNVGISYSTTGVRIDEIPSWVGTGWSLTCGGSISRTMLDRPDDAGPRGVFANGFYDIPVMTAEELEVFLWNSNRFGRDTEPDLFQYNFMGQSGRFILKKDRLTGAISAVPMNGDKTHKISVSLDTSGVNIQILGFTIVDDFGYIYTFGARDKTAVVPSGMGIEPYDDYFSAWHLQDIKSPDQRMLCTFSYQDKTESYLTPTTWTYNNLMNEHPPLDIWGDPIAFLPPVATSFNFITVQSKVLSQVTVPGKGKMVFNISPRTQQLTMQNSYAGYKLNSIDVKSANSELVRSFVFNTFFGAGESDKMFLGSIDEIYAQGIKLTHKFRYKNTTLPRFDSKNKDYWGYNNGAVNQSMSLFNGADRDVNTFFITNGLLESIEYPTAGAQKFEFESNTFSYIGDRLLDPMNTDEIPENKQFVDINTNYASSQANNNNMVVYIHGEQFIDFTFKATSWANTFPHSKNDILGFSMKLVPLTPNTPLNPYNGLTPSLSSFTAGTPKWVAIKNCGALTEYNSQNIIEISECNQTMKLSGWYNIQFATDPLYLAAQPVNYNLRYRYFKLNPQHKITKGGGVRIRKVQLFDDLDQLTAKSSTVYSYNKIGDATLSSGSQNMTAKKKSYYLYRYEFSPNGELPPGSWRYNLLPYLVYDDQSGLDIPLTKGNYVGYKNVVVEKTEGSGGPFSLDLALNGRTEFVYTSPLDYDDNGDMEGYYTTYPFERPLSYDYKRGLLKEKRVYDKDGKILNSEIVDYEFSDVTYEFGFNLKPKDNCDCPVVTGFAHYSGFKGYLMDALNGLYNGHGQEMWDQYWNAGPFGFDPFYGPFNCIRAQRYLYLLPNKYLSGWARMKEKQSDNYYYANGGSTASIHSQKERYSYNFTNKQVSEIKRELSPAESYTTKYYYPNDAVTATILPGGAFTQPQFDALSLMKQNAQHRISVPIQTLTYKNAELIQTQRTLFRNWQSSNGLVLPEIVQASKGSAPLENRVIYSAIDFSNGNPLEVKMANGTPVSYIWGYNKTQPVTKIENMDYASIPAGLIAAVQNASNANPYVEADLLAALAALRAAPALAGAMVTSFTYRPLVGVTTATDPKGQTLYYDYDAFFRLKAVKIKDANGDFNILSSNEYNYKPQSLFP